MTLTIPKQPDPIVKTATIPIIDPGETKAVTFKVGALVPFGEQTTVKVDVDPVAGRDEHHQQHRRVPRHLHAVSASLAVAVAALRGRRSRARRGCSSCGGGSRRVRAAQSVVLAGDSGDLLEFAVSLQARIDDLHRAVDEVAAGLSRVDRRVDGSVTNTAVVRYDAYEGTGGQQSASVALLDATRTGTVLTAIQGRDYARIYVKDLDRGRSSVALSPEEQEAVDRAMAR